MPVTPIVLRESTDVRVTFGLVDALVKDLVEVISLLWGTECNLCVRDDNYLAGLHWCRNPARAIIDS